MTVVQALIVDDSKTSAAVLSKMLRKQAIDAVSVESAEQAIEYLKTSHPAVIFMDHMMPGMDGFDAVKLIKADPDLADIDVVMYTSKVGQIYVGHARALGASDILTKPASDKALSEVLARLNQRFKLKQIHTRKMQPTVELLAPPVISFEDNVVSKDLDVDEPILPAKSKALRSWYWLALLLVGFFIMSSLYFSSQTDLQRLLRERDGLLTVVAWASGRSSQYPYDQAPLSGDGEVLLKDMVKQLHAIGFQGQIGVFIHRGAFCLQDLVNENDILEPVLAPADLPISACSQISGLMTDLERSISEQERYLNNVLNAALTHVTIKLIDKSSSEPLYDYPDDNTILAGEWNLVAMKNNRLQFVLSEK